MAQIENVVRRLLPDSPAGTLCRVQQSAKLEKSDRKWYKLDRAGEEDLTPQERFKRLAGLLVQANMIIMATSSS